MITALFSDDPANWDEYEPHLNSAFQKAGVDVDLVIDADPAQVDYVIYAPASGLADFTPFTNLKAVLSLWAGVETIQSNESIKVPLTRMVDTGLSEGMREYVLGHVLRYHLNTDKHVLNSGGEWLAHTVPPLARQRNIGILGLGELGMACAQACRAIGFNVMGWSRREKFEEGISCFYGEKGLAQILSQSDILVLLLPNTPATQNLLDANRISQMRHGVFLINPGRGALIDDDALLAALETGQIAHATLDVFRIEPLPHTHPFWSHANITVTPHIASETRAETAAMTIAENIRRYEAGEPLLHLVDRQSGY